MQEPDFYTHYQELNEQLAVSELGPSAAEAHGILCAMLGSGEPRAAESWIAELLAGAAEADRSTADPSTEACRRSLQDLAARTRTADGDRRPAPGFYAPVARGLGAPGRAGSGSLRLEPRLSVWSRAGRGGCEPVSGPVREVCDDFAAITHLDLQDLDDSEENERAFMELTEFVRVAAMLVYEEQCPAVRAGR